MVDVIGVGGGLLGMLTARELQRRGAEVMLIERGKAGGEASWAGGGILSPLYPWRYSDAVNRLAQYGHQFYPQLAQALFDESGIDPEYTRSGMLIFDQHENQLAQNWSQQWNVRIDVLDAPTLHALQPGLGVQLDAALWLPEIAQLRNPRLVKSVFGSLAQHSIRCLENTEVIGLEVSKAQFRALKQRIKTTRLIR